MQRDPIDVRGEEAERAARAKTTELARLQEIADLKAVMGTEAGRRFIWRLLDVTGVYRSSYSGPNADVYFREGQRNVGLILITDIHGHCPELLARAAAERQKRVE